MPAKLTPSQRLKVIERALRGENISVLCKEFGISRTLLYRWIRRFKEERRKNKLLALKPKSREVSPNGAVPEDKARLILDLVGKHPEWSVAKIVQNLPKNEEGKPIVGHHGVQNVLTRLNLNTIEKRQKQAQNLQYPPHVYTPDTPEYTTIGFTPVESETLGLPHKEIRPQDRLAMIERVKLGEPVSRVCQLYGVSRTIFYRWLKRYEEAPEGQKLEALWDKKPKVSKYFNQAPEEYEQAVLSAVRKYPELSTHKLVWVLPQVGGRPILGNHGVQNVLRRHNLTTYEQRLAYAAAYQRATAFTRFFGVFESLLFFVGSRRPAVRSFIVKAALSFFLTLFALTASLGAASFSRLVFQTENFAISLGMIFSLLSLSIGTFFFLYSLKYYLTIAIVLSFSRQATVGGYEKEENTASFFDRLFGNITNGKDKDVEASKKYAAGGGLQPDLSGILLSRKPFVSLHLATYNEKRVIDRLLTAATSMDYENYEVIVVDDSTDETLEILKKWENHPRVKVIHRETREGFKGGALQVALENMNPKTEFVLVFDADFIPYPDTITQFLKYFQSVAGTLDFFKEKISNNYQFQMSNIKSEQRQQPPLDIGNLKFDIGNSQRIAAVQGYQWHVLNKSENWITRGVRSEYAGSYVIERPGTEIYSGLKQIAGSVYMIRADVLKDIGWGTSITEDFQLTLKLYEKGYKVVYTPYIQAPAEAVSTIKRLIRQRMRWAEGHSHNIRKMFSRLMFGRWVHVDQTDPQGGKCLISNYSNYSKQAPRLRQGFGGQANPNDQKLGNFGIGNFLGQLGIRSIRNSSSESGSQMKVWKPSPLTLTEKLEFLYLSPYYLQAFLFMLGTFSWFLAEAVFRVRLPFWTEVWGWSLVFTNLFALPLVNMVGLFLEESEEKDYLGLLSFIALSYIVAPFQGYAALKGFLSKEEGPWFRTPKTGKITDIFTPGRFYRYVFGIFGRPAPAIAKMATWSNGLNSYGSHATMQPFNNPYLSLVTANNQFNSFQLSRRDSKLFRRGLLVLLLILVVGLFYSSSVVPFLSRPLERLQVLDTKGKNSEISLGKAGKSLFAFFKPKEAKPRQTEKSGNREKDIQASGPVLRKDFQARENPELIFSFPRGKGEKKGNSVSSVLWPQAQASSEDKFLAQLFSSSGKEIKTPLEVSKGDKGDFRVKVPLLANFIPGVYKLKVKLERGGETFNQEQDFSWGVLALNTNKALYAPGETVFFQMAVLDDFGHTLCDAELELEVMAPDEQVTFFSTQNKTIKKSAECGPKTVTNVPDYLATYEIPSTTGVYKVKLWAQTANGVKTIEDSFGVQENIAFDIEREGPTRIYPQSFYKMRIKIKANQDFKGKVWEFLPEPFEVIGGAGKTQITALEPDVLRLIKEKTGKAPTVEAPWDFAKAQSKQKALSWEVAWRAGGLYELSYQFKAPMISPQFYLLGPLTLSTEVFKEGRQWQIASDAEVTIDNAVSLTPNANQRAPNVVFISDTTGYAFYADSDGTCGYRKTTNGGANWDANVTQITAQTDCLGTTVWYDRWTPGDTTGNYIHIVFNESGGDGSGDDLYYERIDTASSDAQLGEANTTGSNQGGTFAASNSISITKGTDGDLYVATSDNTDSYVLKCTGTCGTGSNWVEAGTNPMDSAEDEVILLPLASANILLINWDISVTINAIRSKVFTDSVGTWAASWTAIGNAVDSISFKHAFDATVNKDTNSLYLCWNNATNATTGDIQTAFYNGSWWEIRDNVTTDLQVYQCSIALDENKGDVYVAYVDYFSAGNADIFYKKSTLGMRSWGTATQVNTTRDNHQSVSLNMMSDQRIFAIWYETDLDDLWGNTVVDLAPPSPFEAHYRWRNDDNSETAASWKAALDTSVSSQNKSENVRARFAVPRSFGLAANYNFRLQVAAKGVASSCETVASGDFSDVPVSGSCGAAVACMAASTQFIDQAATTNQVFTPWTITSNFTAYTEVADALAVDSDYIYLAGYENDDKPGDWINIGRVQNPKWRIEKRRLSDGALCTAANCGTEFGTGGVITVDKHSATGTGGLYSSDRASGIAVSGDFIYVKGFYCANPSTACFESPYNYGWGMEKRNKTTGALCTNTTTCPGDGGFPADATAAGDADGTANDGVIVSSPSANNDTTENNGIAVDSNYLYAVGNCNVGVGDQTNCPGSNGWGLTARLEKRNKVSGALCDSVSDCAAGAFGTSDAGYFVDALSDVDDIFEELVLDTTNSAIYISGQCSINNPGPSSAGPCWSSGATSKKAVVDKIDINTGDLVTAFSSDGRVISDPSTAGDDAFGSIDQDTNYIYVGGICATCAGAGVGSAAYYEKISKSNGSYDTAFDGDGRLIVNIGAGGDDGAESGTIRVGGSSLYLVIGCDGCGPRGGDSTTTAQNNTVIQRRNVSDGTLDTTYGNAGSMIFDPTNRNDGALDAKVSGDYLYLGSYDGAQGAFPDLQIHVEKIDLQSGFNGSFVAGKMIEDTSNQNSAAIALQKERFTEMEYNFQFTSNAVDDTTYCMRVVNSTTALDSYPKVATTVVVPERLWLILPALPFLAKIMKRWKRGRSKK